VPISLDTGSASLIFGKYLLLLLQRHDGRGIVAFVLGMTFGDVERVAEPSTGQKADEWT
jgi:hypothetical protein